MKTESILGAGGVISSIWAALTGCWQIIIVMYIIYGVAFLGNVVTGVLYAVQTDTYSKKKAQHATLMKLGMITGIAVLSIVDVTLMGIALSTGISYKIPFLACLITIYAFVHELSSMVVNIKRLGNKVPNKIEDVLSAAEQSLGQGRLPDIGDIVNRIDKPNVDPGGE